MNQPARAVIQRRYVARAWERLGGAVPGGVALEVGCGRGVGVEIILGRFGAESVHGIDLDPQMIHLARRRLWSLPAARATVEVGDATAIGSRDGAFDAVFDFGAIHLIEDWPLAVGEVRRVLKPGGRFYFEEISGRGYRSLLPLVTQGPSDPRKTGFAEGPFLAEMGRHDFAVRIMRPSKLMVLTGTVGDLIGVGRLQMAGSA